MLGKTLFASLAVCAATAAQAQIRAEHPRFCVMSVGPTQMMFSAFQENKTDEIFCQRVPELGKTMIILDARSNELRDMNIEVRVLRNIDQKDWRDDLEATTVTALPPKKYLRNAARRASLTTSARRANISRSCARRATTARRNMSASIISLSARAMSRRWPQARWPRQWGSAVW
jgi:hypothetical protein